MKTNDFLKAIGVDAETIAALSAENAPEDFNLEDAASAYVAKRRALTLNDPEIEKTIKSQVNAELWPKMVMNVKQAVKKAFGISEEQIEAIRKEGKLDVKDLVLLGKQTVTESSNKDSDEIKKELFEAKASIDRIKEESEARLKAVQDDNANKWLTYKVENKFRDLVEKFDTTVPKKTAHLLLTSTLMQDLNWNIENDQLTVTTKEGKKVDDGKEFLTPGQIVERKLKELAILKMSNGGQGAPPKPPQGGAQGTPPPADDESEAAKALRERIEANAQK